MESNNKIEVNGKKIDLAELSEDELKKLREYLIEEREVLRKKVDDYLEIQSNGSAD